MNSNDRRVRKTQTALKDALIKLLDKKDLHQITLKELTEFADINRSTFYAHYQGIYELYEQLEEDVIKELNSVVKIDTSHNYKGRYEALVDYVYRNARLSKVLLGENSGNKFIDLICSLLEENYLNIWKYEENKSSASVEMQLVTKYHIHGCVSVIVHWVRSDFSCAKNNIIDILNAIDANIECLKIE